MIIGIPKELKDGETRVGLMPKWVEKLAEQGHEMYIQKSLAIPCGTPDEEYIKAGAKVIDTMEELYNKCDMIVKFKDLMAGDLEMPFRKGQILFTAFHMGEGTAKPEQVQRLLSAGITGFSYEVTRNLDGTRALTNPMGEVAGRMAPVLAAQYLQRQYGGSGVSMVPITGVKRAKVVILGGGHGGLAAAQTAEGLGARVVIFEKVTRRLEYLRTVLPNTELRFSESRGIADELKDADVLINAIYAFPGMEVPIVNREMVKSMKPGSVIIDLEGEGIIETYRYTTISEPYFIEEGVLHICIPNIPAMVPQAANETFSRAIFPFVEETAAKGIGKAAMDNPVLRSGIIMVDGKITQEEVAASQNASYTPLSEDILSVL